MRTVIASHRIALVAIVGAMALTGTASAQFHGVVPSEYENTTGTAGFLYFQGAGRTYQMIINESELTQFVGMELNGLSWRLLASAGNSWPLSDATFNNFDIYMGQGVAPADRSLAFAANYNGPVTQVRSGSLVVPTGSFPSGGSPNGWGHEITFDNYLYTGGHLTIEFRHDGMLGATSQSFDGLSTSTSGYLSRFAAIWASGYDTNGTVNNGNFFVTRLSAVPAPGALALLGLAGLATRRRRRA